MSIFSASVCCKTFLFRCSEDHKIDFLIVLCGLALSILAASYFLYRVYVHEFDSTETIAWFEKNSFMVCLISLLCFMNLDNFTTFKSNVFGGFVSFKCQRLLYPKLRQILE